MGGSLNPQFTARREVRLLFHLRRSMIFIGKFEIPGPLGFPLETVGDPPSRVETKRGKKIPKRSRLVTGHVATASSNTLTGSSVWDDACEPIIHHRSHITVAVLLIPTS